MYRTIIMTLQLVCLAYIAAKPQPITPSVQDQTLLYLENRIGRIESKVDDTVRQVMALKHLSARGKL